MSQAALNTRNSEEEVSSRRNNGTRLAGILFLLTVLTTVLVSGWVVLGWMEDAQRLPLSKLVLTGERHYTLCPDNCLWPESPRSANLPGFQNRKHHRPASSALKRVNDQVGAAPPRHQSPPPRNAVSLAPRPVPVEWSCAKLLCLSCRVNLRHIVGNFTVRIRGKGGQIRGGADDLTEIIHIIEFIQRH